MFSPNTVLRKTADGLAEVANRSLGLRAELRRLLIMVDGKSPVSTLSSFVRNAEVGNLLYELFTAGLVELSDGSAPPSQNPGQASSSMAPAATAEPTPEQFKAALTAGVRFLNETLGPAAENFALRLERAKSANELRAAVTEVRVSLERIRDVNTGQRFLEAVRTGAVPS